MSELVNYSRDGEVLIITIDNPPVNALSPGVPQGIAAGIDMANSDETVKSVVVIGAGRTFIAGADINEFGKITSGDKSRDIGLNPVLDKIEQCSKPVVMAIHGTAFGGGLETAMSGHYRVAVPSAQVGQPEVKLGLIPGAGGTQRLPRLAGVEKALQMCVDGNPIKAGEANALGIIDEIVVGDLLQGAVAYARDMAGIDFRKTSERNEKLPSAADAAPLFDAARDTARKKYRNMMAPMAAIEAIEAAVNRPFPEALAEEQRLFTECLFSSQSKAMIHVFFGEREVAKVPGIGKDTPVLPVRNVGIVGAGTMGGGIAMTFLNAGIPVLLKEAGQAALDRGLATIQKNYANSVKRGRFTRQQVDERMKLLTPVLTYDGFGDVDLAIEAVFEGMALKKTVFAELDQACRPGAILASNTSTLSIDEIASSTSRPESVIGTHFFSPANVMKLLEIVRGKATSKEVINTCMQLSKKIGKVGVLVGNCRGFVGNRMFGPYRREAQFLVEEGASVEAVDQALYHFGMAMGPLATGDLAGLDVGWRIRKEFAHLEPPGVRQPVAEDRLCEMGRFGQKTGSGWYKYDEARHATADPEVAALVRQWSAEAGIPQREIGDEEIVRAMHLCPGERGRSHPRGRFRAPRRRYRCRLCVRLRIPGVSRRSHVVRRHDRPGTGVRANS